MLLKQKEKTIKTTRNYVFATRILALLCLTVGLLSHLALTDIAHGEQDVSGEWVIVQVSAFSVFLFILITLITLQRFERLYSGKPDGQQKR